MWVSGLKARCARNSVPACAVRAQRAEAGTQLSTENPVQEAPQPTVHSPYSNTGHKPASSMWLPVKTDAYLDLKCTGDMTTEIYIFPFPRPPGAPRTVSHHSQLQCSSQHQELLQEQPQKPVTCSQWPLPHYCLSPEIWRHVSYLSTDSADETGSRVGRWLMAR